jgi:hypothetical protein
MQQRHGSFPKPIDDDATSSFKSLSPPGQRVMPPSRVAGTTHVHLYPRTRRRRGGTVSAPGVRWLSQSLARARTHYDTLGVKRAASRMQIRDHFYKVCSSSLLCITVMCRLTLLKLSKQHHPDRNPDNRVASEKRMQELSEAYTVLSNDRSRREYDASLEPASRFQASPSTSATSSTSHHYRSTYSDNLRRRQTANYAWSSPRRPPPHPHHRPSPSSRASQQQRPPGDTPLYNSFTQEAERQAKRASRQSQRMDQKAQEHMNEEKKFRSVSGPVRFAGILSLLGAVSMLTHIIRAGLS